MAKKNKVNKKQHEEKIKLLQALNTAQLYYFKDFSLREIFDYLLKTLLDFTESEYGFIGEVLYTEQMQPYLKTYALTDISWNEETKKFYDENDPIGMEFSNPDTLFGSVMTTEKPVIANNPYKDPRRGGLPEGHPALNAFLGLPFLIGEQLVGMAGVANRPGGYDRKIVSYLKLFIEVSGRIIQEHRNKQKRKETENLLFESQQKFQTIFDKATDYIVLIDSDGYIRELNEKIEEGLGYKRKNIIGKHLMEVPYLTDEGKKTVFERSKERLKGGKIPTYELDFFRFDGSSLVGEVNASLVTMRDGTKGDLVIIRDISDRKNAEKEITEKSNDLTRYNENIKLLHKITTAKYKNIVTLLDDFLEAGIKIFDLPTGIISRIEKDKYTVLATKTPLEFLHSGMEFKLEETYCSEVFNSKKTIAFESAVDAAAKKVHPIIPNEFFEAYMSAPIYVGGSIYGTLNFSSTQSREQSFQEFEIEILELMAESIGKFILYDKSQGHRRQIEQALRDSEIRNRTLIDTAVDTIITIDDKGNIESVNNAFVKMFGYKEDEVIGKNVKMLMDIHHKRNHDQYLRNYLTTGKQKIIGLGREVTARRKDGSIIYIDLSVSKMNFGDTIKFAGIIHDITERKAAESNLRLSESRLAKAQEIAHLGNWEWDVQTNELTWSDETYRIFGFDPNKDAATFGSFQKHVHPEDKSALNEVIEAAVKKGTAYTIEHRVILPDKSIRYVRGKGDTTENDKGKVIKLFGTVQDITAIKNAENERIDLINKLQETSNQMNAILDSVGDAIVTINSKHEISTANSAFLEMFNKKEVDVIGETCGCILKELDKDAKYDKSIDSAVLSNSSETERLSSRTHLNVSGNRKIVVEAITTALKDANDNIVGAVKSIRDVSKEAEIDRMKTEFISMVSHELRTPLTSIKGYIDLILGGDTGNINELQREFLDIVYDNSERLNNLINDLLDVEKIEAGKVEMDFTEISLSNVVTIAAKTMEAAARNKGLDFVAKIQDNVTCYGDKDRLTQATANLISNAIKYTKKGSVTILLSKHNGVPVIAVKDTGIGLSKANQKKLFTKFFRADNEYTREVGGTGLGLSIIKAIIDRHGGEVQVNSTLNKGSEFKIMLHPQE
ncbi:PAS domain S-box protein [candidate division KSB1 bacterium]